MPNDMNDPGNHRQWLFVAAAKGLQGYILRSEPLQEMIGASELIEALPRATGAGLFAWATARLGIHLSKDDILTDASGAVRVLFRDETAARRLARHLPMLAAEYAPGLELCLALVEVGAEGLGVAIQRAEHEITVRRSHPVPTLPAAGPWVARNRRTGLPATRLVPALEDEDRRSGKRDAVDEESARKREDGGWSGGVPLLRKVVPPDYLHLVPNDRKQRLERWPNDLTRLVSADSGYLAVIHADANGLGAAMAAGAETFSGPQAARDYTNLCAAIGTASVQAARAALDGVIKITLKEEEERQKRDPRSGLLPIPARPIVCAGEDFTCIVQARHAVRFVADYLGALEQETASRFAALPRPVPDLPRLTGCAGVVFCKSHFPFARAYALAEQLCAFAKRKTRRQSSALAFLRLKSALQPSDDFEAIIEHAFEPPAGVQGEDRLRLTLNPYAAGCVPADLPRLEHLLTLVGVLGRSEDDGQRRALPRSALRELVSRAYESRAAVDRAFRRLELVVKQRPGGDAAWTALTTALKSLTGDVTGDGLWKELPADAPGTVRLATPLYDALELLHLQADS